MYLSTHVVTREKHVMVYKTESTYFTYTSNGSRYIIFYILLRKIKIKVVII